MYEKQQNEQLRAPLRLLRAIRVTRVYEKQQNKQLGAPLRLLRSTKGREQKILYGVIKVAIAVLRSVVRR